MSDPKEPIENELAAMRPRVLRDELIQRIESDLSAQKPGVWADRMLVCAMAAGAMAACMIVGMVAMQEPAASSAVPVNVAAAPDHQRAFALADAHEMDWLK